MKNKIKVLGFYRRKRDGNEYVLYEENGRLLMTNGIFIWRDFVKKKYLPQCDKVEKIDLEAMARNLKKYYPYHLLTEILKTDLLGELDGRKES